MEKRKRFYLISANGTSAGLGGSGAAEDKEEAAKKVRALQTGVDKIISFHFSFFQYLVAAFCHCLCTL